ncbi:type I-F CRISPR-associated protein Csy1 [Pasteurella multocida]|uniref:type I-F CRISPR-associated protein Csy1 n=1 Tax=Pasteurella multocida TaxID=747 RepID=UPI00292E63B8|nr:type I-F CRISPR-associated protein Csy1 [Pasteurella multocida]
MKLERIVDVLKLNSQLIKSEKLEKEEKKLQKTEEPTEREKILQKIAKINREYDYANLMSYRASFMAEQIKFGTHHPKGIHSSAKIECNTIYFDLKTPLPNTFCASQNIDNLTLDASGNAAALPLSKFFDIYVDDEKKIQLRDLLLQDHPVLDYCFAEDPELSVHYKKQFQKTLKSDFDNPISYEKCKQLLWVNSNSSIEDDDYTCLVPLYPSSLIYNFYQKVQFIKYNSDENKLNRENRKKSNVVQKPYKNLVDLAVFKVGGSNPQGVGQLASIQGGRNYLLPSLPPIIPSSRYFRLSSSQTTIFNSHLAYACRYGLRQLFDVVEARKNGYQVRDSRIDALNNILRTFLFHANLLQKQPAGWSKDYQLEMCEKYWLDPKRVHLPDEEAFRAEYEKGEWVAEVERRFALWLNKRLQKRFPHIAKDFDDAEYHEWRRNIRRTLRYRLRHP